MKILKFSSTYSPGPIFSIMALNVDKAEGNDLLANNGNVSVQHTEAIWGDRESYGPSGFKGLFANYYISLCAAFAAVSESSDTMNPHLGRDISLGICFRSGYLQTCSMAS